MTDHVIDTNVLLVATAHDDTSVFKDDHEGHALVPEGLAHIDKSDKKMVAAVLAYRAEGGDCTIVNACDTDWLEHRESIEAHAILVEQLIPEWCQAEYERKHPEQRQKKPRWSPPGKKSR